MHEDFNASTWLIDRHVEDGRGHEIAVRCRAESTTYGEILERVEAVAGGLRALGIRPEERVAMIMLDSVELITAFLGALRIGAIPVLTNPLLPGRDLGVIIADARARTVIISAERTGVLPDLLAGAPEVDEIITTSGDAGTRDWATFVGDASDPRPYRTLADSPGFWLCTSGTTGMPKLAMHSHGDIRSTVETYATHVLELRADDRCYSVGPMFHAYGLGNSLTFPFAVGATAIIEPTRPPTPVLVADIVTGEQPTVFFCIPTFFAALIDSDLPDDTFASVRLAVSAAEALPAETFERFRERFGVTILDGIGSTEMLHIFLSNTDEQCRPGTSGVPVPGYALKIVDDNDAEVGDGIPGHLMVRGESAASGYWCRRSESRSTFAGEWTRTGDLYIRSSDGYYTYLGRADDMLRVGGEWVSPAEVESVLIEHPGVLEAAVVGERDDGGVLRPLAYVVPASEHEIEPEVLAEWCRERLAGYKRPGRFEIVGDLPKTATGKIQRYRLRNNR